MTSNIGHTLLGGGGTGVLPASLAQEMAAGGNFHDNRDSLHDYIYSKLLLGEDNNASIDTSTNNINGGSAPTNVHHTLANSVPVFPTSLVPTYASSINPQAPVMSAVDFTLHTNNQANSNNMVLVGAGNPVSAHNNNIQASSTPEQSRLDLTNATIPSTPQVSTLKPTGGSKKKSHHKNALQQQQQQQQGTGLTQINVPNHEGIMVASKPKKQKSPKQKKEKVNFCDVCGRGFAERYTLNRHMMTHTHVKPYSCTKCNMAFSRSDGLAKHMKAGHRRVDAHHCDVCGGTFNSELSFEQHKREYGTTLPFVCNLCMLAFSQCCHLNYHMKSHSLKSDYGVEVTAETVGEPVDVDKLVPEDFTSPKSKDNPNKINMAAVLSLNSDIRIKHEIDENFPYGNVDGKAGDAFHANNGSGTHPASTTTTTDMSAITNAIAAATGVSGDGNSSSMLAGPDNNNKASISEIEMKKYYDIKIPNPRFLDGSHPSSSSTNTITNDGSTHPLTLFRCHICGKGFTRKYHMQRHVRLHTRGPVPRAHLLDWTRRPYACGVCKMGFTRQHHLTRHMLIHTGERPHSCHICGKAFRRYTNLSLHVRTVHGSERPFKCPICGRGFPRVYSLQRHLNTHGKNSDAQLLMNAGLLPFPKKEETDGGNLGSNTVSGQIKLGGDESQQPQQYLSLGTPAKMSNSGHMSANHGPGEIQHRDALLSDGSDIESSSAGMSSHRHHQHQQGQDQGLDPVRQSEMDRINASIEDTIGEVIKGAMAQGNKKQRTKKSSLSSSTSSSPSSHGHHHHQQQQQQHQHQHHHHPHHQQQHQQQQSSTTPNTTPHTSINASNANHAMQQSEQMINLSLHPQQHQQQQHHHQQQLHHHQQHHHQQQHSRHLTISQDNTQQPDHFTITSSSSSSSSSSHPSNTISRPQQHQRSVGNFNDLAAASMRASTPSSSSFPPHPHPHPAPSTTNSDNRSTTPFTLNQLPPSDGRTPSTYAIVHMPNASSIDRSSTPYSHPPLAPQTNASNMADRSSTPFIINHQQQQGGNMDAFQPTNNSNNTNQATSPVVTATTAVSSRSQQQQQQQLQQLVAQLDTRSESTRGSDPIIFAHPSANGFQFPMGTTMDLSTNQRNRLVVGTNPSTNTATIRQAPAEFGHNLTIGQTALNLNAEAAAFAHVQASNNLSSLFPANATLTYHQQQLMGEALSRLDLELQAAHQGVATVAAGQVTATSLGGNNNTSASSRPF